MDIMETGTETAPSYYSIAEAAAQKGVCYRTAWRAIQQGKLQAIRAGRGVLIPRAAVAAWEPAYERAPHTYQRRRTTPASRACSVVQSESTPTSPVTVTQPDYIKRRLLEHFLDNPFLRDSAHGIARAAGAGLEQVTWALNELAAEGQLQTSRLKDGVIVYAYRS